MRENCEEEEKEFFAFDVQKVIENYTFVSCMGVLPKKLIQTIKLKKSDEVAVIEGAEFFAKLDPGQHLKPSCDQFLFYFIHKQNNHGHYRRYFHCKFSELGSDTVCDQLLSNLNKFYDHLRSHSNEKPFKCTFENCSKAYSQLYKLTEHAKVHTRNMVYKCFICEVKFSCQKRLFSH